MAATMMSTFRQAGVEVSAVASHSAQRSEDFARIFGIPTAIGDVSTLLRNSDIDCVYVANTPADHAATARAALEAGKAVLCEKPLALSAADCEQVMVIARRTGRLCMEGIWTLFLPAYRRFFELACAQACGEPRHLVASFGYPVGPDELSRLVSPAAGGVLFDRGIYLIAFALKLFGEIESLDAQLDVAANGADQQAYLQFQHRGGGWSQLAASFTTLVSNTAMLSCTGGNICLEEPLVGAETVSTRAFASPQHRSNSPMTEPKKVVRVLRQSSFLRRLRRVTTKAQKEHLPYGRDQYLPELEHFLALLHTEAKESDIVPLALSLDIQRVIDRALKHRPA